MDNNMMHPEVGVELQHMTETCPNPWLQFRGEAHLHNENQRIADHATIEVQGVPVAGPGRARLPAQNFALSYFVFAVQFLAEYLNTGFATGSSNITKTSGANQKQISSLPAMLLTLMVSISSIAGGGLADKFGGFLLVIIGGVLVCISVFVAIFAHDIYLIAVTRAFQGLGLGFLTAGMFKIKADVLVDPASLLKKITNAVNIAAAPLGFWIGSLTGSLSESKWYYIIATIVALTLMLALCPGWPSHRQDLRNIRKSEGNFDWYGTAGFTISFALLFVGSYTAGYTDLNMPKFWAPCVSGLVVLIISSFYEKYWVNDPLIPRGFFTLEVSVYSVVDFCFFGSYGVWLYNVPKAFEQSDISSGTLAAWYLPTTLCGILIGILLGFVDGPGFPCGLMLLISGLGCIEAPIYLVLAPVQLVFVPWILLSMIFASFGIDLTYGVALIFFSENQSAEHQAFANSYVSVVNNLGVTFCLTISPNIAKSKMMSLVIDAELKAQTTASDASRRDTIASFNVAAFIACIGSIILVLHILVRWLSRHYRRA